MPPPAPPAASGSGGFFGFVRGGGGQPPASPPSAVVAGDGGGNEISGSMVSSCGGTAKDQNQQKSKKDDDDDVAVAAVAVGSAAAKETAQESAAPSPATATTSSSSAPADDDDDDDGEAGRSTHIEVCARIRPLSVVSESSSGFFEKRQIGGLGGGACKHQRQQQQQQQQQRGSQRLSPTRSLQRKPQVPTSLVGSRLAPPSSSSKRGAAAASGPSQNANNINGSNGGLSPTSEKQQLRSAWDVSSDDTISQSRHTEIVQGRTHQYTVDGVYGPDSSTADVYGRSVRTLVHAALKGFHASVLAYGQTSTGKTHTMSGTPACPGIVPLSINECFSYIRTNRNHHDREYLLRLSYLEVYKEHVRDLLQPSAAAPPVRLYESGGETVVRNAVEEVVTCPDQVFAHLRKGEARRRVGATALNQHSSRSHVLVRLWIESRPRSSPGSAGGTATTVGSASMANSGVRVSSLTLVDLAGSESVRLTGCTDRQQEGHYINQSLMTLGKVVYALSEQKPDNSKSSKRSQGQHIPYRDSKLTRLLQPSLSGNAQVVLICCVSPMAGHLEESHNTLKFALRAKKIPQRAKIHEAKDEKTLLVTYREEIEDLKRQLREAREQQEKLLARQNGSSSSSSKSGSKVTALKAMFEVDDDVVDEDEIAQLVKSIQTMERLILKSKQPEPEDFLDTSMASDYDENALDEEEDNLMALAEKGSFQGKQENAAAATPGAPPHTPSAKAQFPVPPPAREASTDRDLQAELCRVKGLLGSVMKKRRGADAAAASRMASTSQQHEAEEEVKNLRAQLEKHEVTTSLRKADSSFLQKQLEEKDQLLCETAKILEALETRQIQLEAENMRLKGELAQYKQQQVN